MRALIFSVGLSLFSQIAPAIGLPPIELHRIGAVELGMSELKLIEAFPSDRRELVDLQLEGMPAPAYKLRFAGTNRPDGVIAELSPGRGGLTVWRIQIRDPAFRTVKGIGIGATVGQLRAAYRLDSIAAGEGNVVIVVNELGASFSLDQTGPGGDELWKVRTPALVPDSVKIAGILLFQ